MPPIVATTWGCKVGNNVYYDWNGTTSSSGGVLYYNFTGTSGRYTRWDDLYALQPAYSCIRFGNEGAEGCKVNNTIGIRGVFRENPMNCPIDNEFVILGLASLLFLTYLHYSRKPQILN